MRKRAYKIFICIMAIMLVGCARNVLEPTNRDVRLFIRGNAGYDILFELIDENTFVVKEIVAFVGSPYSVSSEIIFDETWFEDFDSKFSIYEEGFGFALSSSDIERGLFREIVNMQEIQLTRRQSIYVYNLIDHIIRSGVAGEFGWLPMLGENINYVLAIIDGEAYWSWNVRMPGYYNENLMRLTEKLFELSPVLCSEGFIRRF